MPQTNKKGHKIVMTQRKTDKHCLDQSDNQNADDSSIKISIEFSKKLPINETPSCSENDLCNAVNNLKVSNVSCVKYVTKKGTLVEIDDRRLQQGSTDSFHGKYEIIEINSTLDFFENENTIVFHGKEYESGLRVAIKRFELLDDFQQYLTAERTLREFHVQYMARNIHFENGKARVLNVLDWYVYESYYIVVTAYEEEFKSDLYYCTTEHAGEHFSEDECKTIFKLIFGLITKMNSNGIYHLDVKPSNILYDENEQKLKLIDFGHSIHNTAEGNPSIDFNCGTEGLKTPQQVQQSGFYSRRYERYFERRDVRCLARDVDLWGCAQVLYFCSQGWYAFESDDEVINKPLEFLVEVSEEYKDLMRRMLAREVEERLNVREVLYHPWLREKVFGG